MSAKKERKLSLELPVITWNFFFIQNQYHHHYYSMKIDHSPPLSAADVFVILIDFFMFAALTQAGVSSLDDFG